MENQTPMEGQRSLPNSVASLVLGIVAILGTCLYGVVGLICGIIGLVLANKDKKMYAETPEEYTESSYKLSNAGRICSIIGLILSAIYIVTILVILIIFGATAASLPWEEMSNGGY
ncbi:MAG: hypothetical protein ACJAU0_001006 [Flavobacteriales bacterium]|jgi:hypothetical protein